MKKTTILLSALLVISILSIIETSANPPRTTHHIKIDQFGYLSNSRKVAVIADPQTGYNGSESFLPGTGTNQYQVRRWDNDSVVFAGTLKSWNGGATHVQSGDKGWWFDFSTVTAPGSYYIFDVANAVGSFRFEIGEAVYKEVLRQAMRVFYLQRVNMAKQSPFADSKWSDGAWFDGPGQDRSATSRFAKGDVSTAKDVHGGWIDAGDLNKYTTFAASAVIQLVEAYRMNAAVFEDDYNIPESGNGVPDVLDEVKWQLDFLKRMQDATGTNGFLLKVGVDNYNEVSPPSTDTRARYYLPECSGATIYGAAMFAASGHVFKSIPQLSAYGQDLLARAELAWARAKGTTANFSIFETECDDGDIKSGDADKTAQEQLDHAFVTAVYLYEATGKEEYRLFAEQNYVNVKPYKISWWGPYNIPQQLALLRLTTLPNISTTTINNIRNQKLNMEYLYSAPTYLAETDLYRAHMNDEAYHWGHNQARSDAGSVNLDYITFGLNTSKHGLYKEVAEQYLHWLHGVNPMGIVMLSNMYSFGGDKCVNEIFHRWFSDGSPWDNALTSTNGPAPGYLPGGPNKSYSGSLSEIKNQPPQKAFKDWNTEWPENSWEIAEPAIYYQASYIMLLARLMSPPSVADTVAPTVPYNLSISSIGTNSVNLSWSASSDNTGVTGYDVYQGTALVKQNVATTSAMIDSLSCGIAYTFTIKAKDAAGNQSAASNEASATTAACAVYGTNIIYDDVLNSLWQDVSQSSTRTFTNTNPVKEGAKSVRVDYLGNGNLALRCVNSVSTSSTTQLRFWVYNEGRNGLVVFTKTGSDVKSTEVVLKPAKGKWTEVIVNMTQLGNPAAIKTVVLRNNNAPGTTMFFDHLHLTNVAPREMSRAMARVSTELALFRPSVFPNPAQHQVTIPFLAKSAGKAVVQLIDHNGRKAREKMFSLQKGNNQLMMDLNNLAAGSYFLRIESRDGIHTEKLTVQR